MTFKRFALIIILAIISISFTFSNPTVADARSKSDAAKRVDAFIAKRIITKVDGSNYWVNENMWSVIKTDTKKALINACAIHYYENGGRHQESTLYGSHSGKKLGKRSSSGIRIYR